MFEIVLANVIAREETFCLKLNIIDFKESKTSLDIVFKSFKYLDLNSTV